MPDRAESQFGEPERCLSDHQRAPGPRDVPPIPKMWMPLWGGGEAGKKRRKLEDEGRFIAASFIKKSQSKAEDGDQAEFGPWTAEKSSLVAPGGGGGLANLSAAALGLLRSTMIPKVALLKF